MGKTIKLPVKRELKISLKKNSTTVEDYSLIHHQKNPPIVEDYSLIHHHLEIRKVLKQI